ncbi:MAG: 2-iminoacetate synthase ThiH [Geoalkalibacter sp.]|jgi:2-iminoacetate synthase|uniref:2-iminoacetate synthase ThiH n=1 Tax=Geoalkalibacter sp. TaxID=3041440 RepID=UPI003D136F93
MTFLDFLKQYDIDRLEETIRTQKAQDVQRALAVERPGPDELMALLSPAAEEFVESMAQKAHAITVQRFGHNILLYAPLYISNECLNGCLYCGFSARNRVPRHTLSLKAVEKEARYLHAQGFRHILLVTGESPKAVDNDYLAAAARRLRPLFSSISIEVYPMETEGYRQMVDSGVDGLTIYQETYDRDLYARMHPFGKKSDFDFRLATPERGGQAGLRRIGIGSLLGLGRFRSEGFLTGLHALFLSRHYWRTQVSVSFPRIRPADGGFSPLHPVSDRQFVQLLCALRLLLPDAGLVLSTRESAALRDNLLPLGITQMSAGSCTAPGGYSDPNHSTQQFAIDDDRSPAEVCCLIRAKGYEAVWKDWDGAFLDRTAEQ